MTKRVCPLSKSAATLGRSRLLTHKEKKSEKKYLFWELPNFFSVFQSKVVAESNFEKRKIYSLRR